MLKSKDRDNRKLRVLNSLKLKFERGDVMEASMDKNGVYFKVGQTVENISPDNNIVWTLESADLLSMNERTRQYSNIVVREEGASCE